MPLIKVLLGSKRQAYIFLDIYVIDTQDNVPVQYMYVYIHIQIHSACTCAHLYVQYPVHIYFQEMSQIFALGCSKDKTGRARGMDELVLN